MPDDLVLELKSGAPSPVDMEVLEKQEHALEHLWHVYLGQVNAAVEGMKGSGLAFENNWRRIILDVAEGRTAEMQAARPRLLTALEHWLDLLKRAHALAQRLRREHGTEQVAEPDVLLPEIAALEQLKAGVFDRWQTAEDLERLAVEYYPLSQSQLRRIAATSAPPADWYAGEEEQLFEE
jgi:hypothetical protein